MTAPRRPTRRPPAAPRRLAAVVEAVEARRLLSTVAPAYADKLGVAGVVAPATTFEDNFDGVALDKTKWQVREGASNRAVRDGPVETITYTSATAVEVANGELTLHAYNDPVTGRVTTAWLQTNNTPPGVKVGSPVAPATLADGYTGDFNQAYGVWEARIKFSSMPGEWGAFWVHAGQVVTVVDAGQVNHPEIYGTEMDVAEHGAVRQGADARAQVSAIVHANGYVQYATDQTVHTTTATLGPSYADPSQYHVYSLYWTDKFARFFVDGNLVNNVTDPTKVSKVAQYIILSTTAGAGGSLLPGTGSNYFGNIPDSGYGDIRASQAKVTLDYVRVWPLANATTTTPDPTPTPTPTPTATGAVVGGLVFVDANGNGKPDAGEAPVANAAVYLDLNYNGKQDAAEPATTTDAAGSYRFADAPAASFGVTLARSTLYAPTAPASGQIAMRAAAGQTYLNRHFGVKLTATDPTPTPTPTPSPTPVPLGTAVVGGTVYVDANRNGVWDGGEAGRPGVAVWLDYDGDNVVDDGEPTATTNTSGVYLFAGVKTNASFAIRLRPNASFARTAPAGDGAIWMRAADGQAYTNRNFGIRLLNVATLSLAGTIAASATKLMAYDALTANKTAYPYATTGSAWTTTAATGWTSGFYPGALWLAYGATGDAATLAAARRWTAGVAGQATDTTNHDVGFQIFDSFGNGYRRTGDATYLPTLRTAANSLSTRFNPKTGAIRSWGNDTGPQQVIIDSMMNLELLEWAAKNGGTSAVAGYSLAQIAISHADRVLANHVRADGSTFHVVEYDPTTGAAKDPNTYTGYKQAYSDTSTWSRGQAWGIYGFTMMYRETGLTRYRDAAQRLADYWIARLPADAVPPADFAYGQPGVPFTTANKDSTAGAVAASAMLELSTLVATDAARSTYFAAAQRMLGALTSPAYLSLDNGFASLLRHGSHDAAAPDDAGYAWGDYYLMEAMTRYQATAATPT